MIKFRVWDKEDKAYAANKYLFEIVPDGKAFDLVSAVDFDDSNGLVIEQYTGLKDVNGKDIYEGDVLKTKAGLIQIVEQGILAIDRDDLISGFYANNLSDDKPHTFSYDDEVIGNVHENPELLEDKSL